MDISTQKDALLEFLFDLPSEVEQKLAKNALDVIMRIHDIGGAHELILSEIWWLYEGVRRVLTGEDSPSNLVAFIQKDVQIEEDNRPKIPALAYEIQTKIFDSVLPILKAAGFPVKEGKVPQPAVSVERLAISKEIEGQSPASRSATTSQATSVSAVSTSLSESSELNAKSTRTIENSTQSGGRYPLNADDKNIRALMRVAAGTVYSEQSLQDAFEELPIGLRQSLSSVDTANAIQAIAKKYLLHVDQMAALASETGLVLLGLTHPADFIPNLGKRLRLKEDDAKEIARAISAEIFAKVRDSLRGLHEDVKPQSAVSVERLAVSKETEKQTFVPPYASTSAAPLSSSELSAKRYPPDGGLNASSNTPYSASAKWNTGDNPSTRAKLGTGLDILAKQAAQKEGPLSRNEVLRGIENPSTIQSTTNLPAPQRARQADYRPPITQEGRGAVGPTGWKPTQPAVSVERLAVSKETEKQTFVQPYASTSAAPLSSSELNAKRYPPDGGLNASAKIRPQSDGAFVPPKPMSQPKDFLEEKLEAPMAVPKVEKRYTTDPYREPLQ